MMHTWRREPNAIRMFPPPSHYKSGGIWRALLGRIATLKGLTTMNTLEQLKQAAPVAPVTDEAFNAVRAVGEKRWADARECARRSGSPGVIELVSELHEAAK